MTIFSKFRDFLSRHRNKFIVGGLLVTGTILMTRYAQQKLKEWHEKETKAFLERTRKQQHFESTERTCNQTILRLLPPLVESLSKEMDTDSVVAQLRTNPDEKVTLWEKLKVMALTKISSMVYLTVMLVVMLRIQLNIVGGYLFKDPNSVTTDVQQKYLLLCNNIIDNGVKTVTELVNKECMKIVGQVELKKQIKIKDIDDIFWAIQNNIATSENNPFNKLNEYIVKNNDAGDNSVYSNMVRDTEDLLESDEVRKLCVHCTTRGFAMVADLLADYFKFGTAAKKTSGVEATTNGFVLPTESHIPLAKLIPIINGLSVRTAAPNQFASHLIMDEKLKTFGANVYECFSHMN